MGKWIVTMALLLLLLPLAAARAEVRVYGMFDLGVAARRGAGTTVERGASNWFGLDIREDLGHGLASTARLEQRFVPDTGESETDMLWQGESTVGLQSAHWGHLRLGRAYSPLWQSKWPFEPWADSEGMGSLGAYQTGSYTSDPSFAHRYANWARIPHGVFWDSPISAGLQLSLATQVQSDGAGRTHGGSLLYTSDRWDGIAAWERNPAGDRIALAAFALKSGGLTVSATTSIVAPHASSTERNATLGLLWTRGTYSLRTGVAYGFQQRKASVGLLASLSPHTSLYADVFHERAPGAGAGITVSF